MKQRTSHKCDRIPQPNMIYAKFPIFSSEMVYYWSNGGQRWFASVQFQWQCGIVRGCIIGAEWQPCVWNLSEFQLNLRPCPIFNAAILQLWLHNCRFATWNVFVVSSCYICYNMVLFAYSWSRYVLNVLSFGQIAVSCSLYSFNSVNLSRLERNRRRNIFSVPFSFFFAGHYLLFRFLCTPGRLD